MLDTAELAKIEALLAEARNDISEATLKLGVCLNEMLREHEPHSHQLDRKLVRLLWEISRISPLSDAPFSSFLSILVLAEHPLAFFSVENDESDVPFKVSVVWSTPGW